MSFVVLQFPVLRSFDAHNLIEVRFFFSWTRDLECASARFDVHSREHRSW